MAISRTCEFEADASVARLTQNPRALARALQRLERIGRQLPLAGDPAFEPYLLQVEQGLAQQSTFPLS